MVWDGGEQNSETVSLSFDVIMSHYCFMETSILELYSLYQLVRGIRCTITVSGVKEQDSFLIHACVSVVG